GGGDDGPRGGARPAALRAGHRDAGARVRHDVPAPPHVGGGRDGVSAPRCAGRADRARPERCDVALARTGAVRVPRRGVRARGLRDDAECPRPAGCDGGRRGRIGREPSRAGGAVTRAHPRVRGGLPARLVSLVFGLFLFAIAIVLLLESRLGLSPWDVLNQGIARHSPLSFGAANVVVGLAILVLAWALGGAPGLGTVANAVLVGTFIQLLPSIGGVADLSSRPLAERIALLVAGIALVGPASALYIGADLGAGPRDTLMLVGAARTRFRVGIVRATLELCALAAGIALGGTFGVGTVLFALLVGPIVEASFGLLGCPPPAG